VEAQSFGLFESNCQKKEMSKTLISESIAGTVYHCQLVVAIAFLLRIRLCRKKSEISIIWIKAEANTRLLKSIAVDVPDSQNMKVAQRLSTQFSVA